MRAARSAPSVGLGRSCLFVSPANVLRPEYFAVLLIGNAFLMLNFLEHVAVAQRYYVDFQWVVFFGCTLSIFLTLRTLKKKTTILNLR
jgi:hypothetical protein